NRCHKEAPLTKFAVLALSICSSLAAAATPPHAFEKKEKPMNALDAAYTSTVLIEATPEQVFAYAKVPENQPSWAINFVRSTRKVGEGTYVMTTPYGDMTYRVRSDASTRTIDFVFETPQGENVLPARVSPCGPGSIFTFTILRMPGTPDAEWAQGKKGMDEELLQLKKLVEAGGKHGARTSP